MIRTLHIKDIPPVPKQLRDGPDYWDGTTSYEGGAESEWWFQEMSEKCNALVSSSLNLNTSVMDGSKLIKIDGIGLPPHDDGGDSKISCIVYLEVPSFGGELVFTKQKKLIKPEKNMLVFFPNTTDFTHMVNVFEGERLVFVVYLTY